MNKAHREVIEVISKELDWCNKNPMPQFSDEYRNGFRNGLIQARYLVTQIGGLTLPAPDKGDSPAQQDLSTLEGNSTAEHEPTPAPCG